MDRPTDELLSRMLQAAAALAEGRAAQVVAEARAEAEDEVKAILKSAMKAALLDRAATELESAPAAFAPEPRVPAPVSSEAFDPTESATLGTYLYAIAAVSTRLRSSLPSLDSGISRVELIEHDDLAAIVSHVPIEGFGTSDQLRDLEWLGRHVQAHDSVIKSAMRSGPVIPLRFCTVFRDDQRVRALLTKHHAPMRSTLDTLAGKSEWGVKIRVDTRAAATSNGNQAISGREYLARKGRSSSKTAAPRRSTPGVAQRVVPQVQSALEEVAVESTTLPLRAGDADRSIVFNGAYLLADERLDDFQARVSKVERERAAEGIHLELTGPWPPYNFVRLDLSSEVEALTP